MAEYNNKADVIEAIRTIRYIGSSTNTPDGLRKAR